MMSRKASFQSSYSSLQSSNGTSDDVILTAAEPSVDGHAGGVGLSDPHYSHGRRQMLDLVNQLYNTGVQLDMDLPVIAVVGNQSAGKSSLIESISGITLPRASGTCTRCPTECRLTYSKNPWRCLVSLRFMTDENGSPLGQVRSEPFGDPITDKALVEERIRRAQRAILNPGRSPRDFLEGYDEDPEQRQLTFSKNCVCLEISGSDVADLSFVDLPGLIVSVGSTGSKGDIDLVKGLVESYISRPSCLILLTVTCETDFENQGAYQLAKQHDEDGRRTIGVLTKPDRIPHGDEDEWLKFIKNTREPLASGWFAVKQPDGKALKAGITWAEAREMEDTFFTSTLPWSGLDADYQRRLRTRNLTNCLSQILSELIAKRLPEIQEEIQAIIHRTEEDLHKLPKPPSDDPVAEVHQLLNAFSMDVGRHIEGMVGGDGLIQTANKENRNFRRAIRLTAPHFRPYKRDTPNQEALPVPGFLSNEDPDEFKDTPAQPLYVEDVIKRMDEAITRELPDHYPFVVVKQLIKKITDKWAVPAHHFADVIHNILTSHVRELISKHFTNFTSGGLNQRVMILVMDCIKECAENARERLNWLLELEGRPFTLNEHYYADYKEKFLDYYRSLARVENENSDVTATLISGRLDSASDAIKQGITEALAALAKAGLNDLNPRDLAKLLAPTGLERALVVMAEVRAYYQVSSKRFIDNVPLAVDYEILRGLERGIHDALFKGLGLGKEDGHQRCRELLQEPTGTVSRRNELQKKRERLYNAKHELMTLSML